MPTAEVQQLSALAERLAHATAPSGGPHPCVRGVKFCLPDRFVANKPAQVPSVRDAKVLCGGSCMVAMQVCLVLPVEVLGDVAELKYAGVLSRVCFSLRARITDEAVAEVQVAVDDCEAFCCCVASLEPGFLHTWVKSVEVVDLRSCTCLYAAKL